MLAHPVQCLATAPPLQSLYLKASEADLGSIADASWWAKHALTSLFLGVTPDGSSGVRKLLASVRSSLTRLVVSARRDRARSWPELDFPALRHVFSDVPVRLSAPRLEEVSLVSWGREFLPQATESGSGSARFPKLASYEDSTFALPLHRLARRSALTNVDISVTNASANACFRYLILHLPRLETMRLVLREPAQLSADQAAAEREQSNCSSPLPAIALPANHCASSRRLGSTTSATVTYQHCARRQRCLSGCRRTPCEPCSLRRLRSKTCKWTLSAQRLTRTASTRC